MATLSRLDGAKGSESVGVNMMAVARALAGYNDIRTPTDTLQHAFPRLDQTIFDDLLNSTTHTSFREELLVESFNLTGKNAERRLEDLRTTIGRTSSKERYRLATEAIIRLRLLPMPTNLDHNHSTISLRGLLTMSVDAGSEEKSLMADRISLFHNSVSAIHLEQQKVHWKWHEDFVCNSSSHCFPLLPHDFHIRSHLLDC